MSDTFNDGDPIDAALLQKLKTDVALATALSAAKVNAGSNINLPGLQNQTPAEIVVPKFFGGSTKTKNVFKDARTTYTINYTRAGFTGIPSAIMLTPISSSGLADIKAPSIIEGSVSRTTAEVQIWGTGNTKKVAIYFIAVENQS